MILSRSDVSKHSTQKGQLWEGPCKHHWQGSESPEARRKTQPDLVSAGSNFQRLTVSTFKHNFWGKKLPGVIQSLVQKEVSLHQNSTQSPYGHEDGFYNLEDQDLV